MAFEGRQSYRVSHTRKQLSARSSVEFETKLRSAEDGKNKNRLRYLRHFQSGVQRTLGYTNMVACPQYRHGSSLSTEYEKDWTHLARDGKNRSALKKLI